MTACAVQAERVSIMGRPTPVVRSEERNGARWAFGHLAARKGKNGIRFEYADTPQHTFSSPAMTPTEAIQAADVLRAAAGNYGGSACGGKTLLDLLWEEMDRIVDRLMTDTDAEDGGDRFRAQGLAYAIAVFTNPYAPNVISVRDEATDRWYEENGEDEG